MAYKIIVFSARMCGVSIRVPSTPRPRAPLQTRFAPTQIARWRSSTVPSYRHLRRLLCA